jgi:hypothetical protein
MSYHLWAVVVRHRPSLEFPRLGKYDHPDLFARAIDEDQAELDRLTRARAEAEGSRLCDRLFPTAARRLPPTLLMFQSTETRR